MGLWGVRFSAWNINSTAGSRNKCGYEVDSIANPAYAKNDTEAKHI